MLTLAEADDLIDRHLGDGFRADHSRLVGAILRKLATATGADADLWHLTGLCHDLDYEVTRSDPARHGLVASGWLAGRLPADALLAIEAHDHQTGVHSDSPLAHALKLADALALLTAATGSAPVLDALRVADTDHELLALVPGKPWLTNMVVEHAAALHCAPAALADAILPALSRS
jgi:predicted hydrolase (HD superfamily)